MNLIQDQPFIIASFLSIIILGAVSSSLLGVDAIIGISVKLEHFVPSYKYIIMYMSAITFCYLT